MHKDLETIVIFISETSLCQVHFVKSTAFKKCRSHPVPPPGCEGTRVVLCFQQVTDMNANRYWKPLPNQLVSLRQPCTFSFTIGVGKLLLASYPTPSQLFQGIRSRLYSMDNNLLESN